MSADTPPTRRPWLVDHFITLRLPEIQERSLFGKKKILRGLLILEEAFMYESGAVLGRARADQAETLLKICFDRWENMYMFRDQAEFHLSLLQKNPEGAYLNLIFELLYKDVPPERRLEVLARNAKQPADYDNAIASLRMVFMWGIAFGARLPQETERLYRQVHESPDQNPEMMRKLGIHRDESAQLPLEEWEAVILDETAVFVSRHYPELVTTLRLGKH